MKRNWILVTLTGVLLGIVTVLILHLHYAGIREVLSQFQEHQLSYAKHLSKEIQFFIQARTRGLKALSSFASLQYGKGAQLKSDIDAYAKQIGMVYVKKISLYDSAGMAIYSTDPAAIGSRRSGDKFFLWARRDENKGKILLTPAFPEPQNLLFLLATPLFQEDGDEKNPGLKRKFMGVLTLTLDMKEFLANQLGAVDPKLTLNQVWIMDKDGTLLFQPDHPEMLFRNIFHREGKCQSCHLTFSYAEEMLQKKQGTFDYQIKSHPQKIAAFASMDFENASWVVVVNAPYDRVTGFIKRSLREHLILIGIVVFAFAISSMLIIRKERMKIKAEEDALRCEEKMAERRKAEEALEQERNKLKESEKRYRLLVETMNEGMGVQDEHGTFIYANDRFCEMLGYAREEMIGRPVTDFLSEADKHTYERQMSTRKNGEFSSYGLPWLKKDGQMIFTRVSPKAIFDEGGQFKGSFAVVTDITERKKAEEALRESERRLRSLSSQLLTAQETERKRISRELHDELGQSLTVMKLRVNFIEKNLSEYQSDLKKECENSVRYIDQVIENIRRLSRDLSPTILEDFGLSAALRWLINNFAKSYNMKVVLDMADIDFLLPRDSHVVVYRTVQEALTNIGKHSRARNVSIGIHEDGKAVLFSIKDDGIGFVQKATGSPEAKGLGLAMMKGRVQMVGGLLDITTNEGQGTLIALSIPMEQATT